MFISKAELQAVKFSSPDESRPGINGLYITERETIATDGHRLIVIERGAVPEFGDGVAFPSIETPVKLPVTISRQSVEAVLKAWPKVKKSDVLPCHQWGYLKSETLTLLDENFKPVRLPVGFNDGKFPNWGQVMPRIEDQPQRIGLNARYLGESEYMTDQKSKLLDIRLKDENSGVLILGENCQGQTCKQVIMPMRLEQTPEQVERASRDGELRSRLYVKEIDIETLGEKIPEITPDSLVDIYGKKYLLKDIEGLLDSLKLAAV